MPKVHLTTSVYTLHFEDA